MLSDSKSPGIEVGGEENYLVYKLPTQVFFPLHKKIALNLERKKIDIRDLRSFLLTKLRTRVRKVQNFKDVVISSTSLHLR